MLAPPTTGTVGALPKDLLPAAASIMRLRSRSSMLSGLSLRGSSGAEVCGEDARGAEVWGDEAGYAEVGGDEARGSLWGSSGADFRRCWGARGSVGGGPPSCGQSMGGCKAVSREDNRGSAVSVGGTALSVGGNALSATVKVWDEDSSGGG